MSGLKDFFMVCCLLLTCGLLTRTLGQRVPVFDTFLDLANRVEVPQVDEQPESIDEQPGTVDRPEYDPPLGPTPTANDHLDYLIGGD